MVVEAGDRTGVRMSMSYLLTHKFGFYIIDD